MSIEYINKLYVGFVFLDILVKLLNGDIIKLVIFENGFDWKMIVVYWG